MLLSLKTGQTKRWNCEIHLTIELATQIVILIKKKWFKLETWQNEKPSGLILLNLTVHVFAPLDLGYSRYETWTNAAGGLWCLAYLVSLWAGLFCLRASLHCVSFSQGVLRSSVRPCRNSVCFSKRAALKICELFQTLIQPTQLYCRHASLDQS